MKIDELLKRARDAQASDLLLVPDKPPCVYVHGHLTLLGNEPLEPGALEAALVEFLTPAQRERQDLIERTHRASTQMAIRMGVPMATGTDTGEVGVTADMVWREVALLVDHGSSAMAAIRAATSAAARLIGLEAEIGSIGTGKLADLVLVDGDPLADIGALSRPVAVWQGGALVSV